MEELSGLPEDCQGAWEQLLEKMGFAAFAPECLVSEQCYAQKAG